MTALSTNFSSLVPILVALTLLTGGCAGPIVYGNAPTTPRIEAPSRTLVLRGLQVANGVSPRIQLSFSQGAAAAVDTMELRAASIQRELQRNLQSQSIRVVFESDAGGLSDREPALLVQYRIVDFSANVDYATEDAFGCVFLGMITLGAGMGVCAGTRHDSVMRMNVEMEVYDVSMAPRERVQDERGNFRVVWDLSSVTPQRLSYELEVKSGMPIWGGDPEQLARDEGERFGQLLTAESFRDIQRLLTIM